MKAYVYILQGKAGDFYIGCSINPLRRYKEHSNKKVISTSKMKDIKMVLVQQYDSLSQARIIESRIKKMKRRDYITRMVSDGFIKIKPK